MLDVAGIPSQREPQLPPERRATARIMVRRVRRSGADATAVRVVAALRVVALLGVAGIGSFTAGAHGRLADLLLALGLLGIPWATIVFFCADRPDNRLAVYGGPLGDLAALLTAQFLLPDSADAVLPGYLVLVAFTVYTVGRSYATFIATLTLAGLVTVHAAAPTSGQLRAAVTLPFAVGVLALLLLVERTATVQARATATSELLRSRADTILAHVADAVFVTDDVGRVVQANAAAELLIGTPAGRAVGQSCAAAVGLHFGDQPLSCDHGCALLALCTGSAEQALDIWHHDAEGRRRPVLADAAEVIGPDGRPEYIHTVRDITRLKQAEEAKTLFLATASHELRTPLTVINGFASTLLTYPDLDEATRHSAFRAIHTRAAELTRIVERLLLSSRIEAGHVELELGPVDLSDLLAERVAACAAGLARRVTFACPDAVPVALAGREAVTTVIDHLLDNAVKYSPNGEPVAVEVSVLDEHVRVEVSDSGIGMDAEQAAHCFDRFWQAESSDVRRFGGTGIGLYIVQSLVEGMRGTIHVVSTPGHGSKFIVDLARADIIHDATETEEPPMGEPTSIREFMRQIGVPERSRP
jgi:PAS domain S-box-containing protein